MIHIFIHKHTLAAVLHSKGGKIPTCFPPFDGGVHGHLQGTLKVMGSQLQVAYNVTTSTSLDMYQNSDPTVQRRYNHFMWLHTTLLEQYPCYFIPSLPEKTGVVPLFNRCPHSPCPCPAHARAELLASSRADSRMTLLKDGA